VDRLTSIEVEVAGQRVALRGDRSLYWREAELLAVADLHLGKTESYRRDGVALPDGVMYDDLLQLAMAVEDTGARRVVVIGDLVHDKQGMTATVRDALWRWRQTIPCALDLVVGNHDRRIAALPAEWDIAVHDPVLELGPFAFSHERPVAHAYTWLGHRHPVAILRSGHERLRLPCFHVSGSSGILPAFTAFTVGAPIDCAADDRVVVAADGRVWDATRLLATR
jgi:DNA ligase-associated metallophosphoesterase